MFTGLLNRSWSWTKHDRWSYLLSLYFKFPPCIHYYYPHFLLLCLSFTSCHWMHWYAIISQLQIVASGRIKFFVVLRHRELNKQNKNLKVFRFNLNQLHRLKVAGYEHIWLILVKYMSKCTATVQSLVDK